MKLHKEYQWQLDIVNKVMNEFKQKGYVSGLVRADTGSGKSYVAKLIANELRTLGLTKILVVTYTINMAEQWNRDYGLNSVNIQQIYTNISTYNTDYDLIVLDECQHYENKFSFIYKFKTKILLGMSATPLNSIRRFTTIFRVGTTTDKPNCKFNYFLFNLTTKEYNAYRILSRKIFRLFELKDSIPYDEFKNRLLLLSLRRRLIVHNSTNRLIAFNQKINDLVINKHTLIITETIKQADNIRLMTFYPVYHSKHKMKISLDNFMNGKIHQLITVKMLREGIDCSLIDNIVIVSSCLSLTNFKQTVGRAMRGNSSKTIVVNIFLAKDTTDEELVLIGKGAIYNENTIQILRYKWKHGSIFTVNQDMKFVEHFSNNDYTIYEQSGTDIEEKIRNIVFDETFRLYENEIIIRVSENDDEIIYSHGNLNIQLKVETTVINE